MKQPRSPSVRIPTATYRIQFNAGFSFASAMDIVPYLYDLGISDIYSSPIFKAKAGSTHGYDITNQNSINPEIGTEEEHKALIRKLRQHGMGLIQDIVPNHMCVASSENKYWMDVLENGPSSLCSNFFDINWNSHEKELANKVLLPILGDQYGQVLENGEIKLVYEEGSFYLCYYEHKFPIRPQTYLNILNHRIGKLTEKFQAEEIHLPEYLSIMTALRNLPNYMEQDKERQRERSREKEIIKKRIHELCKSNDVINEFVTENVEIFNGTVGVVESFDLLDELLRQQIYRLSYWRVAMEEINYRRFFDINELGALRVEDSEVFNITHKLILEMVGRDDVTGLRVDHPDGLFNPGEYFCRLQKSCYINKQLNKDSTEEDRVKAGEEFDQIIQREPDFKAFYIIGEKIFVKEEKMPSDWPIYSSTGYAYLNRLNAIFIDRANHARFDKIYSKFIGQELNFDEIVYQSKQLVMQTAMASEINTLGHYLTNIATRDRHTRDFTHNSLIKVIIEVISCFPVYRTYISSSDVSETDRIYIEMAVEGAIHRNPAINVTIFDFLKNILLMKTPYIYAGEEQYKKDCLLFVMKFQQITGPVMAKGFEDTACYIYNRLISLNEVGGYPDVFGIALDDFHEANKQRFSSIACSMISTSTHDTKRSEDARARINVLSELPSKWQQLLSSLHRINKKHTTLINEMTVPDKNTEYLLYQALTSVWPYDLTSNEEQRHSFTDRIKGFMIKAVREAKLHTSWINENSNYENALTLFIGRIMGSDEFMEAFIPFCKLVSSYGVFNSLSQVILKITSPGIPDFYQGTEMLNYSLVDPDNRRPVDYPPLMEALCKIKDRGKETGDQAQAVELLTHKEDGLIKLFVIYKLLNFRKAHRRIFEEGTYMPLEAHGEKSDNICSFSRFVHKTENIIVVAPRMFTKLVKTPQQLPTGKKVWTNTYINLPYNKFASTTRSSRLIRINVLTDEEIVIKRAKKHYRLEISELFRTFPFAVLKL